jgi:hypothetical protein
VVVGDNSGDGDDGGDDSGGYAKSENFGKSGTSYLI